MARGPKNIDIDTISNMLNIDKITISKIFKKVVQREKIDDILCSVTNNVIAPIKHTRTTYKVIISFRSPTPPLIIEYCPAPYPEKSQWKLYLEEKHFLGVKYITHTSNKSKVVSFLRSFLSIVQ